ncbi:hypothetical protein Aduo_013578 [Ancylostoma duodenale]
MLWLLFTYLLLPSLDGHSPMARRPTLSASEEPEEVSTQLELSLHNHLNPTHERRPRSPQYDEQLRTLNSFHDTGYFSQYRLDDRVYDASFLLKTLKSLDVYDSNARTKYYTTPLFDRRHRTHKQVTFRELADEALAKTRNTTFENLTKFKVANLIGNHLVYYLEAKKLLENTRNHDDGRRERRILRGIIVLLEETILHGDVPYNEVEKSIGILHRRYKSTTFIRLNQDNEWIEKQIMNHLNTGNDHDYIDYLQ